MNTKAKQEYDGRMIDKLATTAVGTLVQVWLSDTDLACANSHCRNEIPAGTEFTVHTKSWWNGYTWKHRNNEVYCRTCVPFYERNSD